MFNKNREEANKLELKYKKAIPLVGFNLIIVSYFVFWWFYSFYEPKEFNCYYAIRDLLIAQYTGNPLFYFVHRLCHKYKFLYRFHIVHHEFKEPIGICAVYTHPIDYIFANLIPLGITPFALGMDIHTLSLLTIMGAYKTVKEEHSNYSDNRHHLNHHKYFNCNYGEGWLDTLFGTIKNQ